jgi:hypothetical protein
MRILRTLTLTIIINTDQSASGALGTVNVTNQTDTTAPFEILGTTDGQTLVFTGNEGLTNQTGNGQASIQATDGSWSLMAIQFQNGWLFDRIVFNLGSDVNNLNATVTAFNQANVQVAQQVMVLSGNGNNFINVCVSADGNNCSAGSASERISRITISALSNATTALAIDTIQQVRVGGLAPSPVPEPSTFAMFGAALVGLGLLRRKRGI